MQGRPVEHAHLSLSALLCALALLVAGCAGDPTDASLLPGGGAVPNLSPVTVAFEFYDGTPYLPMADTTVSGVGLYVESASSAELIVSIHDGSGAPNFLCDGIDRAAYIR